MRRRSLRSLAIAVAAFGTSFAGIARAETVEECQALGVELPPAKVAACQAAYVDAIIASPKRSMYTVDPSALPTRLHSAISDNTTSGAYREFDKTTVRERSSDATYRSLDLRVMVTDLSTDFPWLQNLGIQQQPIGTAPTVVIGFPPLLTSPISLPSIGMPMGFVDPDTFRAHVAWENRGDHFNSCQEYAWKLFFEHSRFADSARVCGNDMDCIADLAFAPTRPPAIAYGDIHTINGVKAPAQLKLVSGAPSKNLFFASSPWYLREQDAALATNFDKYEKDEAYVRANGGCAFMTPGPYSACAEYFEESVHGREKLAAIDDLLRKKYFYSFGTSWITPILKALGSTELEKFPTEWDFHAAMRTRVPTGSVPEHERRSIEERTAYLEKLITAYVETTSLRACRAPDMAQGPNGADVIDGLGPSIIDLIGGASPDPWVQRWAVGSLSTDLVALSAQQTSLISPIGIVDTTGARLDVPSLVGQNKALLPSGFTAVPAGQFMAVAKSNRTKTALATGPIDVIVEGGKTQTMSLTTTEISLPGNGSIKRNGISGSLPSGLTKLAAAAACTTYDASSVTKLSTRGKAIVEKARDIQHQIVELLVEEYDRKEEGCLSLAGYKCDWSPALLAARFVEQLATEKQNALNECQAFGGDLSEAKLEDKNRVSNFATYVAEKKAENDAALRQLPTYKKDDKVVAGEADHGDFYRGDSEWFGAGYNYDVGWSFAPVHALGTAAGSDPAACGVLLDANARFEANAAILGPLLDKICVDGLPGPASELIATLTSAYGGAAIMAMCELHDRLKHFIDVSASVTTDADAKTDATRGKFAGEIIVENKRLFSSSGTFTVPTVQEGENVLFKVDGVVSGPSYETPRASATIVVVVVPVTFQAFGELHVGAQITGKVIQTAKCGTSPPSFSVKANLGFAPFARATARASAAIGVSGLQAGIRGSVVLIDARLPLNGSIAAGVDGLGAFIQPAFDASLTTTFLSGGLSAFAEVGPFLGVKYTAEKEIFSFDGFNRNLGLWSYKPAKINVSALNTSTWNKFMTERKSGGSL